MHIAIPTNKNMVILTNLNGFRKLEKVRNRTLVYLNNGQEELIDVKIDVILKYFEYEKIRKYYYLMGLKSEYQTKPKPMPKPPGLYCLFTL
jgi:hypothetical protein